MKKRKKDKKTMDVLIVIILVILVAAMAIFTMTRETSNQEIILMEIYKCAGPDTDITSMTHYYIYENTNHIEIRSSNSDGSNNTISKGINKDLIDDFKNALDEYINKNVTINTSFHINERYTIEYNGSSIIVPNPSIAGILGYDSTQYIFYNTVEEFINNIK